MAAFKRMGEKTFLWIKTLNCPPMPASNWMVLQLGALFTIEPGESRAQNFTVGMGRGGKQKKNIFPS